MKLLSQADETLAGLSDASRRVIETTEWATIALVCVAAVSVLALLVGTIALGRTSAA